MVRRTGHQDLFTSTTPLRTIFVQSGRMNIMMLASNTTKATTTTTTRTPTLSTDRCHIGPMRSNVGYADYAASDSLISTVDEVVNATMLHSILSMCVLRLSQQVLSYISSGLLPQSNNSVTGHRSCKEQLHHHLQHYRQQLHGTTIRLHCCRGRCQHECQIYVMLA